MSTIKEKELQLIEKIKKYTPLAIAYSGSVESTYLLKVAVETLGNDNVLGVVMSSDLFAEDEFDQAIDIASSYGVKVLGLEMNELKNPRVAANTPKSWYYSRKLAYQTIKKNIQLEGYTYLADAFVMDDYEDFRPGLKARDEEEILSFLQEVELYRDEIRQLAKEQHISNWNKLASGNVASRFPYGTHLTKKAVLKVFKGESFIKRLGFKVVRLRVHHNLARIEIPPEDFEAFLKVKEEVSNYLKTLGYQYIALDIDGFKSGRMNDVLDTKAKENAFK